MEGLSETVYSKTLAKKNIQRSWSMSAKLQHNIHFCRLPVPSLHLGVVRLFDRVQILPYDIIKLESIPEPRFPTRHFANWFTDRDILRLVRINPKDHLICLIP